MQTPKSRTSSSGAPSPRSISSSRKHSPRVVRQLSISPRYSEPTASSLNQASKPPKDRSPKVRKSPRSPLPEEKHPSRVAERESQIAQLENDLKNVKGQLCASESSKKPAQKDAEESNQQPLALSIKLEESKKQLLELSPSTKIDIIDSAALNEVKHLEARLEMVAESAHIELNKLKEELAEALVSVEEMKNQLSDCKKSEAQAQELVGETLMQLETAKKMVEALQSDGCKASETHDAVKSELEWTRGRVNFLEDLVSKLKAGISCKESQNEDDNLEIKVERLRDALKVAEVRHNEELKNALDMVECIKSESGQREAELEAELRKSSYEIEELKANLMDKETELQAICEENDTLLMRENELEEKIKKMEREMESAKARLKSVSEERDNKVREARDGEQEALKTVGCMSEEINKSSKKVARVTEQLEAAQAANAEMEAELRRLKVQSDQWRKAAEVAAAMLSGQFVERTSSMDHHYNNYGEDFEDDLMKKKNVNMLRRFGVLWKKPLK